MANAKRCDRCLAFYDKPMIADDTSLKNEHVGWINWGANGSQANAQDLCSECAKSFINWFINGQFGNVQ